MPGQQGIAHATKSDIMAGHKPGHVLSSNILSRSVDLAAVEEDYENNAIHSKG